MWCRLYKLCPGLVQGQISHEIACRSLKVTCGHVLVTWDHHLCLLPVNTESCSDFGSEPHCSARPADLHCFPGHCGLVKLNAQAITSDSCCIKKICLFASTYPTARVSPVCSIIVAGFQFKEYWAPYGPAGETIPGKQTCSFPPLTQLMM